jgi:hypothetical protein
MKRAVAILVAAALPCGAYSALSHEAVIDAVWKTNIQPMLTARFPGLTPDQIKEAHAYAYGGSQIQDMGYFPFGSHLFSDLTHYVRSADFVTALIKDAQTPDEYAFALGALAHYTSDRYGHPAVNRSTAREYPKMERKYGPVVTYEENPADHLRTEFAFDVIQVAHGLYAPDQYQSFIGFEVAENLLQRAFQDTYGIELKSIFGDLELGIGTYRWTVGTIIPRMTKVAWDSKRADIQKLSPGITRSKFVYALPRREYRKRWDGHYKEPGIWTRFFAFIFRLVPTVGPFKVLRFPPVPPAAEADFLRSFDVTVEHYRTELNAVKAGNLKIENRNLDTGDPVRPGDYHLADKTYASLLDHLQKNQFAGVSPELKRNIESYYQAADPETLSNKTKTQLDALR